MTNHFEQGDIVQVKFTNIFGSIFKKVDNPLAGEIIYEITCLDTFTPMLCREGALILITKQKERIFN